MPDHVHLFLSCTPLDPPVKIVKILKGVTVLALFKQFPELRQKEWKCILWSPLYYIETADHISAQTIERYIRDQEK